MYYEKENDLPDNIANLTDEDLHKLKKEYDLLLEKYHTPLEAMTATQYNRMKHLEWVLKKKNIKI